MLTLVIMRLEKKKFFTMYFFILEFSQQRLSHTAVSGVPRLPSSKDITLLASAYYLLTCRSYAYFDTCKFLMDYVKFYIS